MPEMTSKEFKSDTEYWMERGRRIERMQKIRHEKIYGSLDRRIEEIAKRIRTGGLDAVINYDLIEVSSALKQYFNLNDNGVYKLITNWQNKI